MRLVVSSVKGRLFVVYIVEPPCELEQKRLVSVDAVVRTEAFAVDLSSALAATAGTVLLAVNCVAERAVYLPSLNLHVPSDPVLNHGDHNRLHSFSARQ